jgi:hypothetical protein
MAVSPSGGGSVSPSSGWYNSGTNVGISESPSTNYVFDDWTGSGTGSYSGTSTSATITMSAPITETANYYSPVTITFTSSSMSGTSGTVVTVDGTNVAYSSLPYSITVPYSSSVAYSYASPIAGSSGTQYAYSSLSGCGQSAQSNSFSATSTCTVTASYTTQYYLTMAVSPSGGGTVSPGSGWYNAGSGVTISESPATNYVFDDWTCSGSGCYSGTATSATITMNNPITETANYYSPVTITFTSSSMSGTSGTVVTVDGTNIAYSSLPYSITVPYGSTVTYSYASPIGGSSGTQYAYSSLSGCGQSAQSNSFSATSTCTVTASYTTQYYLTMAGVNPSGAGSVSPGSGWYNAGSGVTISESPATNYVFDDWTCSGTGCYSGTATSTSITMSAPITETANYYSPVTITFTSSSMSGTSGTVVTVDGTNVAYSSLPYSILVPYGSTVTYSYASPIGGSSGTQYAYSSLSGCGQSAQSGSFSATSTCTVTASYTTQYYLTMAGVRPSGGGSVSPGSGWYNAGSGVSISENPASNSTAIGWTGSGTGSYSGTATSTSITMSAPITETALFAVKIYYGQASYEGNTGTEGPWDIYDPSDGYMYMITASGNVTVFDGSTVVTTLDVPVDPSAGTSSCNPWSLVYDPSNNYIYIGCYNYIDVISGVSQVAWIYTGLSQTGWGVYNPSDGLVYFEAGTEVITISGTSFYAGVTAQPVGAVYNPSNGDIYTLDDPNIALLHNGAIVATIPEPTYSSGGNGYPCGFGSNAQTQQQITYDPSNQYVYIATITGQNTNCPAQIYAVDGTSLVANTYLTGLNSTASGAHNIVYDPSNNYMYVDGILTGGDIAVDIISGGSVLTSTSFGYMRLFAMAYDPANGYMYVGAANVSNTALSNAGIGNESTTANTYPEVAFRTTTTIHNVYFDEHLLGINSADNVVSNINLGVFYGQYVEGIANIIPDSRGDLYVLPAGGYNYNSTVGKDYIYLIGT